jgi:hypothetical protein
MGTTLRLISDSGLPRPRHSPGHLPAGAAFTGFDSAHVALIVAVLALVGIAALIAAWRLRKVGV